MRDLERNTRKMYYALYVSETSSDPDFDPLDVASSYSEPVEFWASLSDGKSNANEEPFGTNVDYSRVISTTDKTLPITETSLIWYETEPQVDVNGKAIASSADYKVATKPLDALSGTRIAIKFKK